MTVKLIGAPTEQDWLEVKRRAYVTIGLDTSIPPSYAWKWKILNARHSPIRYLMFSFYIECPYWVSVHLSRHIHAQPYVQSQRNDRQDSYDRNSAPQDSPVRMIFDVNAEELMNIANKRLCMLASKETREVVQEMCVKASEVCQEIKPFLVPMCDYTSGICHEMKPCGRRPTNENQKD